MADALDNFALLESVNPFKINLIIENLSLFLTYEDLKTCRGLNTQWKETLEKEFLKRSVPLEIVGVGLLDKQRKHQISISRLMDLAGDFDNKDPLGPLFRRFQNISLIDSQTLPLLPHIYMYLDAAGSRMKRLYIHSAGMVRNVEDFVAILSCQFTPLLEYLCVFICKQNWDPITLPGDSLKTVVITAQTNKFMKEIRVGGVNIDESEESNINNISWLNILSLYPNLKSFVLYGWPHVVFKRISLAISDIRRGDTQKLNLKKLCLYGGPEYVSEWKSTALGKAHCKEVNRLLVAANFQLEDIRLDDAAGLFNLEFVEKHRLSIKNLALESVMTHETFHMMPKLEKLYIGETLNFTFLTKTPILVNLKIGPPYYNNSPILWPDDSHFHPILTLRRLKSTTTLFLSTELHLLFTWVPNISVLEMRLNNDGMGCVCEHLLKLRKLTVLGEHLSDEGVVGIDSMDEETDGVTKFNITNLHDLEVFRMTDLVNNVGLTARSFTYGFLRLNKLKTLIVTLKSELNPEIMERLSSKLTTVMLEVKRRL